MNRGARYSWLALALCAALGFAIYANSLQVPFYLDDQRNFIDNPATHLRDLSPQSLWRAAFDSPLWSRPVANLSFALNYYLHQDAVPGYHLVNILIHVLAGFFFFQLARSTLSTPALHNQERDRFVIPLLAALLWLAHPLHTQSVTYIVQRMNSLAVMFYLASLWLYARGRLAGEEERGWPWLAAAGTAGLLALGSKEVALTLPVFIVLYEIYFFRDLDRRWLKGLALALLLLGVCAAAVLVLSVDDPGRLLTSYAKRPFTPGERVLTELRVVIWYLGLLFYPQPGRLNLDHDFALSRSLLQPPTTLLALAAIVLLLLLAAVSARKERLLSFALLWYFGNLFLESSLANLELVFEHRTYLPSVFLTLALVDLWLRRVRPVWLARGSVALAILFLAMWTVQRNQLWRDPVAFWEDSAAKSPGAARPLINLSVAYQDRGEYSRAVAAAQKAIRLDPRFVNGFVALAAAYEKEGEYDLAIAAYREALRRLPDYAEVYNNLAGVYLRKGMLDQATAALRENLRLAPGDAKALVNLASIMAAQGRYGEAIVDFQRAMELGEQSPDVLFNLALAYDRSGDAAKAMATYREVLARNPADVQARQNLDRLRRGAKPTP